MNELDVCVHQPSRSMRYLSFDVSVENLPVVDVFEAEANLNEPAHNLRNTQLV